MSVPDFRHVPRKLFDTGLYNLKTEDGAGAFVDACVATLHGLDERWGHLRKNASQTHVHGHGEDAALYLSDVDGESQAVDFVGGAGGPNPQPAWQVDIPRYSRKDWIDPFEHGLDHAPPPPAPLHEHPGREEMMLAGEWLDAFYRSSDGLQRSLTKNGGPDWEGIGAWLFDVFFMARVAGKTNEQAKAAVVAEIQKTDEWRRKHQ